MRSCYMYLSLFTCILPVNCLSKPSPINGIARIASNDKKTSKWLFICFGIREGVTEHYMYCISLHFCSFSTRLAVENSSLGLHFSCGTVSLPHKFRGY